jgi:hypothetical protein
MPKTAVVKGTQLCRSANERELRCMKRDGERSQRPIFSASFYLPAVGFIPPPPRSGTKNLASVHTYVSVIFLVHDTRQYS